MKIEKAIRLVEIVFGYSSAIHDGLKPAEKIAIEAMKKQMPMKPMCKGKNLYCPNCDQWLLWDDAIPNEGDNYCGICGQKIDWED